MKISREAFDDAVAEEWQDDGNSLDDMVIAVLSKLGITVEPPDLPDVSPGEWYLFSYENDPEIPSQVRTTIGDTTIVLATSQATWVDLTSSRSGVTRDLPHENNTKVMAGSKKLVELLVVSYQALRMSYDDFRPETRAVIDHLRDKIGVDVSEFVEEK